MDWTMVIDRNREALLRIVAMLFALAGLSTDLPRGPATLPRHLRSYLTRILRPAESAARRLIAIAAHGIATIRPPVGAFMYGLDPDAARSRARKTGGRDDGAVQRLAPFALLDPLRRFSFEPPRRRSKGFPRICVPGVSEPTPIPDGWFLLPGDAVSATGLCARLHALKRALDDIDAQARRLARWQARRDRAGDCPGRRTSPLRTGRPPGRRKRQVHEVDAVLRDLHLLALHALSPDTS